MLKRWQIGCLLASVAALGSSAAADEARPEAAHSLRAAVGASPRPPECRLEPRTAGGEQRGVWRRANRPALARYCDLLAHGYARLKEAPGESLSASARAAKTQPERVSPFLLRARALHALGRDKEAWAAFESALQRTPDLRLSPDAQLDFARSGAAQGLVQQALSAYRKLVPMAGLLTTTGATECVYVEAASQVMLAEPQRVAEAVAYLGEARRRSAAPPLRPFVLGALALALDRQGRSEEARGVINEARGRTAWLALSPAESEASPFGNIEMPRVARAELSAMLAMLSSADDTAAAAEHWGEVISAAPQSYPWLDHARRRLQELRR